MNIAILIGVANYRTQADLPACGFDAENMRRLLAATKKYADIELIVKSTDASQVKDALRKFFARHQGNGDIEEAFIYFSGHGLYQNDALLCCSDFDTSRPATTSISNNELDDLLRSVSPRVAVKVIDACQSGSPYIKEASVSFEKALGASQLKSFICMASSRQDQQSYASATESYFTSRWIESALVKSDGEILYRDIQAALADAFVSNPSQTPFFTNQGTGLEVFTSVTEELKSLRTERSKAAPVMKSQVTIEHLIAAKIRELDAQFVPRAKVLEASEKSREELENRGVSDGVVGKFYKTTVSVDGKLESIPKSRAVAAFAEEQAWPKRYFVKVKQEPYQVRTLKDSLASLGRLFTAHGDDDYVVQTKFRAGSLETTESLPIEVAQVLFTSEHPSDVPP